MKILFFLGFPNPFAGAAWSRIGFFAEYFRKKGCKVYVIGIFSPRTCTKAGSAYWHGVKILNISPTIWAGELVSLFFNILSSIISIPLALFILRPQLLIVSVPRGEFAVGAHIASKIFRIKLIIDYRDEWEDFLINRSKLRLYRYVYKILKTLMTRIYMESDLVITVTHSFAKTLRLRNVKNIKILPNGADTIIFKPHNKANVRRKLGIKENDFVMVYSGTIGEYYRIDIVIKALAKLMNKYRNLKFIIVGNGPDISKVIKIAKILKIYEKVLYLGVKNDKKELVDILSSADVGIIPYDDNILWKDSLPAKFFEYCACGIPVIATVYSDSILADLIRENGIGLVSKPLDDDNLANALEIFYQNENFRRNASKNARSLIERRFDRNKIAEIFLDSIRLLI